MRPASQYQTPSSRLGSLGTVRFVSAAALDAGKRSLVLDAAWASVTGAWSGGVVLVAFALSLKASPMTIGLLAAIPFVAQVAQLPTIFLVEKLRRRKLIGIPALTIARLVILLLAVLPFVSPVSLRIPLLVIAQILIAVLGSVGACAINSWFHQLLPAQNLGKFFGHRLLVASLLACVSTLAAGILVDHPPLGKVEYAFAIAFAGAGLAGFASSLCLARTPEPDMPSSSKVAALGEVLKQPLRDENFRRLLFMLGGWNLASNLTAPFLTVYLLQMGYTLSAVTGLWVCSQMSNATALYLWGRLSDTLSNKAILAVALPAYFTATLGLVFIGSSELRELQTFLLIVLHVLLGMSSGGISLATGNLGLKLAPREHGTPYLAVIGLVSAVAGGAAPLIGGALAQALSATELSVVIRWTSASRSEELGVLSFMHWDFLFVLSAVLGLYVMHALSRIREGNDISERVVIQELALEAMRTINHLSTIGGVLGSVFSFATFSQHRRAGVRRKPAEQIFPVRDGPPAP